MDIKQIIKWSLTALAVIAFHHAQGNQASHVMPEAVYRVKYENTTDMPDHLAYLRLMQNLHIAERETGRSSNIEHIREHLDTSREDAERFLDLVLGSYDEMIETNRAVTNRMLCAGDKPKYEVAKAYAVLDVLDDIKETNLKKQYRRAQVELGAAHSEQLEQWLAVIKMGSSHHKYDHKQVFEHQNQSVEQVISTACNLLAAYTPST